MIAGYQNSINHDAVVMIDGDLQHPPEYIPHMIEGFIEGYDQVIAKKIVKVRTSHVNPCHDYIIK